MYCKLPSCLLQLDRRIDVRSRTQQKQIEMSGCATGCRPPAAGNLLHRSSRSRCAAAAVASSSALGTGREVAIRDFRDSE
jgi:hypothetical protein